MKQHVKYTGTFGTIFWVPEGDPWCWVLFGPPLALSYFIFWFPAHPTHTHPAHRHPPPPPTTTTHDPPTHATCISPTERY